MADQEQNRSEAPSAHKLARARRQGQVARGIDLGFLSTLSAFLIFSWIAGSGLVLALLHMMQSALISSAQVSADRSSIMAMVAALAKLIATPLLNLIGTIFMVVLAFELLQTGFVMSSEPLRPDFSKLNPANGLKRLFTVKLLIETVKNVLKLGLYACATWFVVRGAIRSDGGAFGSVASLGKALINTSVRLLTIYAGLAAAFAILDQLITRRDFFKKMRMSKREVKQEHRDREGEPRLKQKRKQMHAEFVRGSRSVKGLRGADMLIVNPQHIAIALRYDPHAMAAPIITSVGVNHLALRLKRLAFIYAIPVIEDRRLARLLLGGAKIDHPIPASSYQPVADLYNRLRRQRAEDMK